MMEFLANFHFLRPWWLLALLPAVIVLFRLWRRHGQGSAWKQAIDRSLLPYLLDSRPGGSQRLPLMLLASAWSLAIIALAGPTWERLPQPVQERQDALVVVLDQSLNMFATDLEPNRHTVAVRKLNDILDRRIEGQTGLVVYSEQGHLVTPLTQDNDTIQNLVPALSPNIMPAFGNNPAHGIQLGLELLEENPGVRGRILLISGHVPPSQRERISGLLAETPYPLSILAVGTGDGAPIPAAEGDFLTDSSGQQVVPSMDGSALENLAGSMGGRYHEIALSSADLDHLLTENRLPGEDEYIESDREFDVWRDAGPWLVLLLLPLGAMLFRRGWVLSLTLAGSVILGLNPTPARAQPMDWWQDLWQTRNQQGAQAWEQEEHERAAELFRSPEWQGTANYRAGNYEEAIEAFSQGEDVDSLYNQGNAYARAQQFEQAISAYEAVLEQDGDHEDARQNKAIVERMLEQQQQEQQQQQDQEQSEQDEESQQQQQQEQQAAEQAEEGAEDDNTEEERQQPDSPDSQSPSEEPESARSEQQQQDQESNSDSSNDTQRNSNSTQTEDEESLEQWLRRIEDDPEELLQRKFRFEYQQRQREERNARRQL